MDTPECGEQQHILEGPYCWCHPEIVVYGDVFVVVHNDPPPDWVLH